MIVILPAFAALCDWQVHRALSGNQLSWAYVFEWPFFGGYAVYMWWRILHEAPAGTALDGGGTAAGATTDAPGPAESAPVTGIDVDSTPDPDAEERDAYNRYLSDLATRGRRKQWR
jgi:hypothetical protein